MAESKRDEIEKLLAEIQFDRWIFGFPTWFTVVSHGHRDHDPFGTSFPQPLVFSLNYRPRWRRLEHVEAVYIGEGVTRKIKGVRLTPIGPRVLSQILNTNIHWLHACWWLLRYKKVSALFIGELDVGEVGFLKKLLERIRCDALLLPAYGGIRSAHGATEPMELSRLIENLALEEKGKGTFIYALPHPVSPSWAERCAVLLTP